MTAATESRRYDFAMSAYGTFILSAVGKRFVIKSATGAVRVKTNTGDDLNGLEGGQGLGSDTQFSRLEITDISGAANSGYIIVSDDAFIDNRITGEVSVIDGEQARTIAQGRFFGSPSITSGAATFAIQQLWNPAASGKQLIITGLNCSTSVAGTMVIFGDTAQRLNLQANYGNGYLGGSAPSAEMRYELSGGIPPYALGLMASFNCQAGGTQSMPLSGPIVVPPSAGLSILCNQFSSFVVSNFEWWERAV